MTRRAKKQAITQDQRLVRVTLHMIVASSTLRSARPASRRSLNRAADALKRVLCEMRDEANADTLAVVTTIEGVAKRLPQGAYTPTRGAILDDTDLRRLETAETVRRVTKELEDLLRRHGGRVGVLRAAYLALVAGLNRADYVRLSIADAQRRAGSRSGGRAAAPDPEGRRLLQEWADEIWTKASKQSKRQVAARIIDEKIKPSLDDPEMIAELGDPDIRRRVIEAIQRPLKRPEAI